MPLTSTWQSWISFLEWHLLYYVLTCFVTGGISPLPTFATKLSACNVFLQGSVFASWFMTPLCPIGVECAPLWASSLGGSYLPSWLLMASRGGRTYLLLGSVTHPFYCTQEMLWTWNVVNKWSREWIACFKSILRASLVTRAMFERGRPSLDVS